ncbi:NrsF family protein [Asticcacaulis sp. AND118]|uniref:NrsF family protein n=1 Tax=Asticcacaulis sp. AND118 TaxID=2840468 RepID=UPI001CFFC5D9|nr:NrsF family protein [Asticcacaulis sp. AND118]UDF05159.1 NrsF family protein [Asticcacaulis sp. AND118]
MVEPQRDPIERLIIDLRPVTPLNPLRLLLLSVVVAGLILAVVFSIYGIRPDIFRSAEDGAWIPPTAILKPLMWAWVGFSALHVVVDLSRPEGRLHWSDLAPLPVVALGQLGLTSLEVAREGWAATFAPGFGQANLCAGTLLAATFLGMRLADPVWLKFTASSHPMVLRLMTAIAFATLAAAAYALHCPMDQPYYMVGVYTPAIAFAALIESTRPL